MSTDKSLYILLKEANLLNVEKYISNPTRCREKVSGWMWSGELEVVTKDNLRLIFNFWENFHDDDGKNWYPSQKLLDDSWRIKFVPKERSNNRTLSDATWHLIYIGDHVYVSKSGFFDTERFDFDKFRSVNKKRDRIEESIMSGNMDDDVWMII